MKRFPVAAALLTGTFLGLSGGAAFAQSAVPATAASSNDADGQSSEIIVTAQRRGEKLSRVPISVSVQTAETLAAANIVSLREMTLVTPGLNYTSNGPFAQPTIRGQSTDSAVIGNEPNVAVYLDGVYQPIALGHYYELADVTQIEVLKGPQGTLFGRNASAGAIQVFTRDPAFETEGQVSVTGSLYDTRGIRAGVKGFVTTPLSQQAAISVSGYYNHDTGYYHDVLRDERVGKLNSGLIRAKLLLQPAEGLRLIATAYYSKNKDESTYLFYPLSPYPASLVGPHAQRPYETSVNETGFFEAKTYGASLRGELEIGGGTLTSTTAYSKFFSHQISDGDATSLALAAYNLKPRNHSFQQEVIYASPANKPVTFVGGVFYFNSVDRYDPLDVGTTSTTPFISIYARTGTDAIAGFGEVNVTPTESLTISGGLRYSTEKRTYDGGLTPTLARIGSKRFHAWTPRVSVRYEFAPSSNVYFTFSKGFKSGLFDATSFSPIPYEPEKVQAYELGVKAQVTRNFNLTAAIFRNDVTDRQVNANGPNNLPILSNAAASRIDGGELSLNWRSGTGLTVNASASYFPTSQYTSYPNAVVQAPDPVNGGAINITRDLSGARIQKTPKFQSSLLVSYETDVDWGKIGASTNISYSSSFFYTVGGYVRQPSYTMVNANLSWAPLSERFKVIAFVKNLANEVVIQNFVQLGVAYQPPRQYGLTLEAKF